MTSVLTLEGVTLRYADATVLDSLSLDLQPAETVALLGPSGSGKTTIVRMLLGFEVPQTGTVRVAGEIATRDGRLSVLPEDRKLAVVFQDLALWPHLTVTQHLSFGLESQRLPAAACASRIQAMLQRVGLADRAQSYPLQLSGGERQRVAIARALVLEPRAVLLDEPLANLDVVLRDELLRLFDDLLSARATPALYVTHDLREAAALADRIAVLEHGRIVQCGSLEVLCTRPATEFIRRLVEDLERPVVGTTFSGQTPSAVR
jgi:iron(III) transport system ATP-binding protein